MRKAKQSWHLRDILVVCTANYGVLFVPIPTVRPVVMFLCLEVLNRSLPRYKPGITK